MALDPGMGWAMATLHRGEVVLIWPDKVVLNLVLLQAGHEATQAVTTLIQKSIDSQV
jgi:hypothetical protein